MPNTLAQPAQGPAQHHYYHAAPRAPEPQRLPMLVAGAGVAAVIGFLGWMGNEFLYIEKMLAQTLERSTQQGIVLGDMNDEIDTLGSRVHRIEGWLMDNSPPDRRFWNGAAHGPR